MKITAFYNKGASSCYHRVVLPLRYISLPETIVQFIGHHEYLFDKDLNSDIIFLSRTSPWPIPMLINAKNEYGAKVVLDLDDYWYLYPKHVLYDSWQSSGMAAKILNMIDIADMVFVTNERLARKVSELNDNVYVVPNALPFGKEQFVPRQSVRQGLVRFGYVAGKTHLYDFAELRNTFHKLRSSRYYDRYLFSICGVSASNDPDKEVWIKMVNMALINRYHQALAQRSINNYMELYDGLDVSVAPVENNIFNGYKSNLKIIESGCKKVPIICSARDPYLEDSEISGKGGFLCRNTREWENAISFYVEHPDRITEHGNWLYNYVKERYDLSDSNDLRERLFLKVVGWKEESSVN